MERMKLSVSPPLCTRALGLTPSTLLALGPALMLVFTTLPPAPSILSLWIASTPLSYGLLPL
ncbi:unnamed protein product, partial [Brassica oleracea var. botrytis]